MRPYWPDLMRDDLAMAPSVKHHGKLLQGCFLRSTLLHSKSTGDHETIRLAQSILFASQICSYLFTALSMSIRRAEFMR
jgi:hypothetical protein